MAHHSVSQQEEPSPFKKMYVQSKKELQTPQADFSKELRIQFIISGDFNPSVLCLCFIQKKLKISYNIFVQWVYVKEIDKRCAIKEPWQEKKWSN